MRTALISASLLLALGVGCAHADKTRAEEESEKKNGEKKADAKDKEKGEERGEAKNGTTKRTPTRVETITTSKTTKQMFKPDGIKRLQAALDDKLKKVKEPPKNENDPKALQADKGPQTDDRKKAEKIEDVKETNVLDTKTQLALQQFQKSEGLPETGLPDYESLRRLGLKPAEIYEHDTPSERVGVQ